MLAQQQGYQSLVLLVVIFGIFWFLMIAPMRKKEKVLQKMRQDLKSGDKVITQGGLLGTVVSAEGHICKIRIADNVKVAVLTSSIVGLQQPEDEKP